MSSRSGAAANEQPQRAEKRGRAEKTNFPVSKMRRVVGLSLLRRSRLGHEPELKKANSQKNRKRL
jgi:hypothetical protein